jgi:hypothetical protein
LLAKILAAGMLLLLAAPGSALACQAKNATPVMDENFRIPDPGWGPPDDAASFTAAGLVLKPPVNGSAWRWNPNYSVNGHDLCVTVTNPAQLPMRPADIGDVGIWFWSRNAQNFYTATFSLNGTASIDRLVNGVWHVVMAPRLAGAIKTEPGAENQVEVVLKGDTGVFYINGMRVGDFHGDAPANGGAPGVYAESGNSPVSWAFSRVQMY